MHIHQYEYLYSNGQAIATPIRVPANGKALKYATAPVIDCASQDSMHTLVGTLLEKLSAKVPLTTRAHLLLAHCRPASKTASAEEWFSMAEALITRQTHHKQTAPYRDEWLEWLDATWPAVALPESFSSMFKSCATGKDVFDFLATPALKNLPLICVIALSQNTPLYPDGGTAPGAALAKNFTWADKQGALSFRAVYPEISREGSRKIMTFTTKSTSMFKLKDIWHYREESKPINRKEMQEIELLKLKHLVNPDPKELLKVITFLKEKCAFTSEEIIENELPNIDKKNNVLTKLLFETLLGSNWDSVKGQLEMLKVTGYPVEDLASVIIDGCTNNKIAENEATGEMDLPPLPDFLV